MNVRTTASGLAFLTALLLAPGAAADEWDSATATDGGPGTSNTLVHGSTQVHDLTAFSGTADEDWYRLTVRPMSSYQAVIDGQTGDVAFQFADFQRVTETGTVLQGAQESESALVLDLAWLEGGTVSAVPRFVRVRDAACGTDCDFDDRYRIHFYETTYTIPRFNNTATQTTVLLVQNTTQRSCAVAFYLISGTLIVEATTHISPHEVKVVNTAPIAPNRSGAVRVVHDCGYGALAGKAVAVEPATGFTFDTPMRPRAN